MDYNFYSGKEDFQWQIADEPLSSKTFLNRTPINKGDNFAFALFVVNEDGDPMYDLSLASEKLVRSTENRWDVLIGILKPDEVDSFTLFEFKENVFYLFKKLNVEDVITNE